MTFGHFHRDNLYRYDPSSIGQSGWLFLCLVNTLGIKIKGYHFPRVRALLVVAIAAFVVTYDHLVLKVIGVRVEMVGCPLECPIRQKLTIVIVNATIF